MCLTIFFVNIPSVCYVWLRSHAFYWVEGANQSDDGNSGQKSVCRGDPCQKIAFYLRTHYEHSHVSLQELRGTLGFQNCFYKHLAMASKKHWLDENAGAHKDCRWLATTGNRIHIFRVNARAHKGFRCLGPLGCKSKTRVSVGYR